MNAYVLVCLRTQNEQIKISSVCLPVDWVCGHTKVLKELADPYKIW